MFIVGNGTDAIIEYNLSIPYDVTSASASGATVSMTFLDTTPRDITFNESGSRMYVVGSGTDLVFEFILTTEFDLSTASYTGNSLSVGGQDTTPTDISFNRDGTKFFLVGAAGDAVYEYNLSTAYDLSTAVFSTSFAVTGVSAPQAFEFNINGSKLFVLGNSTDRVWEYHLTTGFDLTTASATGISYYIGSEEATSEGFTLSKDGTQFFTVGISSDNVNSYTVSNAVIQESAANDGNVVGEFIVSVIGETFINAGSQFGGSEYSIDNLPAGLIPLNSISADGLSVTFFFVAPATNNNDIDDVSDIQVTFADAAFAGGTEAVAVTNAVAGTGGLSIDFFDNPAPEVRYSSPIEISSANLTSSLDVSAQLTAPTGIEFSPDGLVMFAVGSTTNNIVEYTLSTPFDVSTATPTGITYDMTILDGTPKDVGFNANGSRMYVAGTDTDRIYEFALSTEYDLSTAAYTGNFLFTGTEDTGLGDFTFNLDGSKLFTNGSGNDAIYEYNLSTNYDITTAAFSQSVGIGSQEATVYSLEFNADGSSLLIIGSNDRVYQYDLTTNFDLLTATYTGVFYYVGSEEGTPEAMTLSPDGTKLFIAGSGSDNIYAYDLDGNIFRETAANDGSVEGSMIMTVLGETFTSPGVSMTESTDYTIDTDVTSLTPNVDVSSDGLSAVLSFTGSKTGNEDIDDITDLTFSFTDAAFAGGSTASSVINGVSASTGLGLDFNDNLPTEITYANPVQVSKANNVGNISVNTEDTAPTGIEFTPDGSKMFITGNNTNTVIEYTLGVSFDVTTAAPTGITLNMTDFDGTPTDIAFNANGSRMFISGTDNDRIYEFHLSSEYDLSTADFTGDILTTGTEDTGLGDISFNRDGSKLFTVGSANDAVYEYDLAINYDITSATFSQSFSIGTQEATVLSFEFNADGSHLFIVGSSSDRVHQYFLTTEFDLSTASYSGISYLVQPEETTPEGMTLSPDGTHMYIVGVSSDNVWTYDLTRTVIRETAANDGTVEGFLSIGVVGESFINPGTTLTSGTDYTVDNLPAGLTPTLFVSGDGLTGALVLSGSATSNDDGNDLTDIQLTFNNSAFAGGTPASSVANAVTGSSNLELDFNDNLSPKIEYSSPIQVSTATLSNSFDISTEDTAPTGLEFSPDGLKLFAVGNSGNRVLEYDLSIAFDVSTAASTGIFYDMTVLDGTPTDVAFNANGSRMFVSATDTDDIFEFVLSTEYDLSTASYSGNSLDLSTEDTGIGDFAFNGDGSKLFAVGSVNDAMYEYDLSVNYDITTAIFSQSFAVGTQEGTPLSFEFVADGSRLFVVGSSTDRVHEYHLFTGYDLSTAFYSGISHFVGGEEGTPEALTLNRDGTQMFITGVSSDNVHTYDFSKSVFRETAENIGAVEGYMIISAVAEAFTNPGGSLTESTHYTVDNLPSGLIPDVTVSADGLFATLTLSGAALSNDNLDDVSDIQLTFTDAAFTGGTAAASVGNAVGGSSNLAIDFTDNIVPEVSYSAPIEISKAVFDVAHSVSTEDTSPVGLAFSRDGMKMFVVGNSNNTIIEYDLSTAYAVNTAVPTGVTYSMTFLDGTPTDVAFNPNGSRMYVVGTDFDNIYEFNLSSEYDLSTASYTGNTLNLTAEDSAPGDIAFNQDGSKLFFVGSVNDAVYEYDLIINYDITTAVFNQSFSVVAQEATSLAMEFNANGTKLFVVGSNTDRVFEYHLSVGFDLGSAVYSGVSYFLDGAENTPEGFAFSRDGTQMFITGVSSDNVLAYNLGSNAFRETASNDGVVEGEMLITLQSEAFVNGGSVLTEGTHYTVDNIPVGLSPDIMVSTDGLSGILTLAGTAANNDNADDVTDLQLTFTDAAFSGGTAAASVTNAVTGTSGLAIDFTDNLAPEIVYSSPVRLSTAVVGSSADISAEDSAPVGLEFSPDGLKLITVGNGSDVMAEYSLLVPYDVTTMTSTGVTYPVGNLDGTPTDIAFNANGSRLYLVGLNSDNIYEFHLENEYDLSSASLTGNVLYVGTEDGNPGDIAFNKDGSKLFMAGNLNDSIYSYDLGINFDITTATYSNAMHIGFQVPVVLAFEFNDDGTRLFAVGSSVDRVQQYDLTVGYDISTATYSGVSYYVGGLEQAPEGFTLSKDGTKFFITGVNSDAVQTYDMSTNVFTEATANDGTLVGSMIVGLVGEGFSNPGGSLSEGVDYTIDNMPAGLTSVLSVNGDGTAANLTFTGSALSNDDVDDVTDIQFTFTNTAFTGGTDASSVNNAVSGSSNLAINFTPNPTPEVSYAAVPVLSTGAAAESLDGSTEDTNMFGFAFNNDGSKFFAAGATNDNIYQYDLGTNWDISTAVFNTALDVNHEIPNPAGVDFSLDGTRMIVAGLSNGIIAEYILEQPFELSTASYSGNSLDVSTEETNIVDLKWSNDGMDLFMIGDISDEVHHYTVSTAYDITTAVYSGNSFSIATETLGPNGVDFNADGTQMIVASNFVFVYNLTTGYDITTASYSGFALDVSNEEQFLENAHFAENDSKLIISGTFNGLFRTYDLSKDAFRETAANDGSVEGGLIVSLVGDFFNNPGATLTHATDFTVTNLPVGLEPVLNVTPNGTIARLSFTGNATNNLHFDDIDDISIDFANSAFIGGNAAGINNATAALTGLGIDFNGGVIHVSDDAVGSNDGSDWTNAYTSLDFALGDAVPGDTIVIEAGTYYPSIEMDIDGSGGSDARERVFYIPADLTIHGGFDGTETTFDEATLGARDFVTNETILSGDFNGDDGYPVTDLSPGTAIAPFNITENAYHVLFVGGSLGNSTFSGLTISGGNADGTSDNNIGGGLLVDISDGGFSNILINHVRFVNNSAQYGGGMYSRLPTGSLIYRMEASAFEANVAEQGGAIAYEVTSIGALRGDINASQFVNNVASDLAGAIAYSMGGGQDFGEVSNCLFSNNTATNGGGAIVYGATSGSLNPWMYNNVFHENTSGSGAGILLNLNGSTSSNFVLLNNTFTLNEATTIGGGISFSGTDGGIVPQLVNNLFWNNTAAAAEDSWETSGASYSPNASNNAIPEAALPVGTTDGTGNVLSLAADPFVDISTIDVEPASVSSIVDAGLDYFDGSDNVFSDFVISLDYTGRIRLRSTAVDIGAVEYSQDQPLPYTSDAAEINNSTPTAASSTLTISDIGFLQDLDDRVRFANNGSANTFVTSDVTNVYAQERLNREWYLEISDDPTIALGGPLSFAFDLETPLDLATETFVLLYRSNPGDEFESVSITDVIASGNTVELRSLDNLLSGYYTVGRSSNVAPGRALAMDAVNDRFTIFNTQHNETFTYEAWVRPNEGSPNNNGILITNNIADPHVYVTLSSSGTLNVNMTDELANEKDYLGTIVINDNQWHHIAVTNDGGNDLRMYIDGVEDTPSINMDDVLQPTTYATTMIGGFSASFTYLRGEMDEVRIWSSARSLADIQLNISTRLTGAVPNLISYVSFDQTSDDEFSPDFSGNGAHLRTIGIDFNGTTSDWVPSGAFTLDFIDPIITVDAIATPDRSPELTGTIDDPDATIDIQVDGNNYAATNNGDDTWTLAAGTISPDLADGTYDVIATATDLFSNVGTDATTDELTITSELTALPASNITSSSFQANWSGGIDVAEYFIDISLEADFSTFFDGFDNFSVGTTTSLELTDLDFGTTFYYRLRFENTSSVVSEDSEVITVSTTTEQETIDDFAALTDIYNALDGENWTDNTGWLTSRLQDWNLVTIDPSTQRVTAINLSSNNLSGSFPDITLGLEVLTNLNLSGNAINGIGDISNLVALTDLDVSANELEFDDLEPLVPLAITNFTYNNQASLQFIAEANQANLKQTDRLGTVRIAPHLDPYTISFSTGGTTNSYTYLVDGTPIANGGDYTIVVSTATINSINFDNMGEFSAQVTNSQLPDLTLNVDPEYVFATADIEMTITDFDNVPLVDNISGYLLEAFKRESGFDTLERAEDVASGFIFPDVVLGDYLCGIDPSNREAFIPSYLGDVFEWDLADTVEIRSDVALSVRVTAVPTEVLNGEGVLDIVVEEDFDDDGGKVFARRRAAGRKCGLKKRRSGGRQDDEVFELVAYGETDENGEFQFGQLPEGVYRFFVEYPGIPLDESSFVQFEVGEQGISDTEFSLTAFASEDGLVVTIERVLGVILEYFKDLKVYPNPSDEFVNIRYRHLKSRDVTAQLVDLSGNTMWSEDLQSGFDGYLKIDVSDFTGGIYILRFYDRTSRNENVMSYRIFVNK